MGNLAVAIASAMYDFKNGTIETIDELIEQLDNDFNNVSV